MHSHPKALYSFLTIILLSAIYAAATTTTAVQAKIMQKTTLDNVRDYTPAWLRVGTVAPYHYAIDSGYLYVGTANQWHEISLPTDVIAGAVATDPYHEETIYVGAANEMALYVSRNQGYSWQRVRLDQKYLGGVTDIAMNGAQRTIYVGTDNSGIYRLRDVGSSIILDGHTPFTKPVLQIVSDQFGAGMLFARTKLTIYRGMNNGQQWLALDGFDTIPTSMAIANSHPAAVYIGTSDRGLLRSTNGFTWQLLDDVLPLSSGTQTQINALAVDPAQPEVLYVARSLRTGLVTSHLNTPSINMSRDGGLTWESLAIPQAQAANGGSVTDLLPVSGEPGALFALSTTSRTLIPLGNAGTMANAAMPIISARANAGQTSRAIHISSWLIVLLVATLLTWLVWQEWHQRPTLVPVPVRMR